jgi:hypothetical protein
VKEFLDEIGRWVDRYAGAWGTRVLAFVIAILVYGLVWFVVSTFRRVLDRIARPNPDEPRGLTLLRGLLQIGLALALLVWLVRVAIADFPDWLGIDDLGRP